MPETASHADILRAVHKCQQDIGVLIMDMQSLKGAMADIKRCLGEEKEDERGEKYGIGLVGSHMRLAARVDKRFRSFDDWRNYALGAMAASSLMVAVIWWLIRVRVGQVLQ